MDHIRMVLHRFHSVFFRCRHPRDVIFPIIVAAVVAVVSVSVVVVVVVIVFALRQGLPTDGP